MNGSSLSAIIARLSHRRGGAIPIEEKTEMMKYKLFGTSGLRVAELSLGALTFGTESGWGEDEAEFENRAYAAPLDPGGRSRARAIRGSGRLPLSVNALPVAAQ
jgi:hypothetical protein